MNRAEKGEKRRIGKMTQGGKLENWREEKRERTDGKRKRMEDRGQD